MFINLTNHPSRQWGINQINASLVYGNIIDIPFPNIDPNFNKEKVDELANFYVDKIVRLSPKAVLVQGEMTFCFEVVKQLKEQGIIVVCACSIRDTVETHSTDDNTVKETLFSFVQYREY